MPVNEDAELGETRFVFSLPVQPEWVGNLASITLSGPDGTVTLDQNTNRPMAILRDPSRGQVRGILQDLPGSSRSPADAAAALSIDPSLEVLFSRGIPNPSTWRR